MMSDGPRVRQICYCLPDARGEDEEGVKADLVRYRDVP